MRNGNKFLLALPQGQQMRVCSLPMRNGNRDENTSSKRRPKVCSLPMRNGNSSFSNLFAISSNCVCSLPMRNGNLSGAHHLFSPTKVCSLPMRNGNISWGVRFTTFIEFVAYLWGMETRSTRPAGWHGIQFVAYLWGMETRANVGCASLATG